MKKDELEHIRLDDPNEVARGLLVSAATLLKLQHGQTAPEVKESAINALDAWHHLYEIISHDKNYEQDDPDDLASLLQLRDDILGVTNHSDMPPYLASAMEQLLTHTEDLIKAQKTDKIKQIFPVLSENNIRPSAMMISGMKHYRLCATCLDCDEVIFKDLRVPQIVKLTGRDAPWTEFKVKCQTDRTHHVEMISRYDPRNEKELPSFYRGAPLDPITD